MTRIAVRVVSRSHTIPAAVLPRLLRSINALPAGVIPASNPIRINMRKNIPGYLEYILSVIVVL